METWGQVNLNVRKFRTYHKTYIQEIKIYFNKMSGQGDRKQQVVIYIHYEAEGTYKPLERSDVLTVTGKLRKSNSTLDKLSRANHIIGTKYTVRH